MTLWASHPVIIHFYVNLHASSGHSKGDIIPACLHCRLSSTFYGIEKIQQPITVVYRLSNRPKNSADIAVVSKHIVSRPHSSCMSMKYLTNNRVFPPGDVGIN